MLTFEEEKELSERRKKGDNSAANKLVEENLLLAKSIASKYKKSGVVDFDDVLQNAYEGLVIASTRYDGTTGVRFGTYAYYWICQKIKRGFYKDNSVTLPEWIKVKNEEYNRWYWNFIRDNNTAPSLEDIMEHYDCDAITAKKISFDYNTCSLDSPVTENGNPLIDFVPGEEDTHIEEIIENDNLNQMFNKLVDKCGVSGEIFWKNVIDGLSFKEIAPDYGKSGEWCRIQYNKCIEKIKQDEELVKLLTGDAGTTLLYEFF